MSSNQQNNARQTALIILDTWNRRKGQIQSVLHERLEKSDNKAKTTDIVYGVVRNLNCIDSIIGQISGRKIEQVSKKLINVLRIGTYEILYCSRIAPYAIVNEAAEIAKKMSSPRQAGFVNAVLRNILRQVHDFSKYKCLEKLTEKMIPLSPETAISFKSPMLPNPQKQPAGYLSKAFSIPQWLIETWITEFGLKKSFEICLASNRKPSIYLMPNTLKLTNIELFNYLQGHEINCQLADRLIRLNTNTPINKIPGFDKGLFSVQDPAAASIFNGIEIKQGSTILDICSAPGGKTIRLAQKIKDKGQIIATDINPGRLNKVRQNCDRMNIKSVKMVNIEEITKIAREHVFDIILLDVPCSNTGVLARRIEVRHKINPAAVNKIRKIQSDILQLAVEVSSDTTRIIYSTCSIQPDENCLQITEFLQNFPEFGLNRQILTLPEYNKITNNDSDGGYLAELVKNS